MDRCINQYEEVNEPFQNTGLLHICVITKNVAKKNVQRKKA